MKDSSMKKTEILKVRVDKETHAALMRYCEGSRQSSSYVLRAALTERFLEGNEIHKAAAGNPAARKEERARFVRSIAAILIAEQVSLTGHQQHSRHQPREVARLVDALLGAISGDPDQEPPTPPPFAAEEQVACAAGPEPKYG
jgi:predicted transcriptional regulator